MLFIYYIMIGQNAKSNNTNQNFKERTIAHDFDRTELKKASKRIVILDHLYGEILEPLDITPIRGATTGQTDS